MNKTAPIHPEGLMGHITIILAAALLQVGCGEAPRSDGHDLIEINRAGPVSAVAVPTSWQEARRHEGLMEPRGGILPLAPRRVVRSTGQTPISPPVGPPGSAPSHFGTALHCVTSQTGVGPMARPRVARILVAPQINSSYLMHVSRGPMLRGTLEYDEAAVTQRLEPMSAEIIQDGDERWVSGHLTLPNGMGIRTLGLELIREDDFFYGTYSDQIGALREEHQVTCWEQLHDLRPDDFITAPLRPRVAYFDRDIGGCVNAQGHEHYNVVPIEYVRETGDGMCADLRGFRLNGDDYTYPTMTGWNLTGALLDGAELNFAQLKFTQLIGAKMRNMSLGYAKIEGYINGETVLPTEADCETSGDDEMGRVTCIR